MKKISLTLATAITALSLTAPVLAAPLSTNAYCGEKVNLITSVMANGSCNKSDLAKYILNNYVLNKDQSTNQGNNGSSNNNGCGLWNNCTNGGSCNGNNCNNKYTKKLYSIF